MRALASQERLTFKRTAASLAVSRGEKSRCGLFIGRSLRVFGVTPRRAPLWPHASCACLRCGGTGGNSGRRTPDCEENLPLVGGAHPKCGLDLLKSRLGTAGNLG